MCANLICDYTWRYAGRFSFYATCPSCRRNVKISENKVEPLQYVQVRGHKQAAAFVKAKAAKELMNNDNG
jgi:hypothetical protein